MSSRLLGQKDYQRVASFLENMGVFLNDLNPCMVIFQTEDVKHEVWTLLATPVFHKPFCVSQRLEVSISYHDDNSLRLTLFLYVNFRDQIVTKTLRAYWFGDNSAPEIKIS